MENLLEIQLKQTVPTHAVKFIIGNIISFFLVIIVTFLFVMREYNVNNIIRADFFALGLMCALGDLVLIATGIASIYDYKKRIRKRIDDIIKTEKYCNNIIQQAIEDNR